MKGEIVDMVGEPTALLKEWDAQKQEIVLRTGVGSFTEVFKVVPETRPAREVLAVPRPIREAPRESPGNVGGPTLDPLSRLFKDGNGAERPPSNSTLDDERVTRLERERKVRQAAAAIGAYLRDRKLRREEETGGT